MHAESKTQAENTRSTVPQHVLDRFESEWQQMRLNSSSAPKSQQDEATRR